MASGTNLINEKTKEKMSVRESTVTERFGNLRVEVKSSSETISANVGSDGGKTVSDSSKTVDVNKIELSDKELAAIRKIVLLHEATMKNEKSVDQSGETKVVASGSGQQRRSVKERLGTRVEPNQKSFAELHYHLEIQPCRFGWDRLSTSCMIRFGTRLLVEDDDFPRRCFIDPWSPWSATGEETFGGRRGQKIVSCEPGLITFEWKTRGNNPFSYDRVADSVITLPSGKNFEHNVGIITNFCKTTIYSLDFILQHRVRFTWWPSTGTGYMRLYGEDVEVEVLVGGPPRPIDQNFSFNPLEFATKHRDLFEL